MGFLHSTIYVTLLRINFTWNTFVRPALYRCFYAWPHIFSLLLKHVTFTMFSLEAWSIKKNYQTIDLLNIKSIISFSIKFELRSQPLICLNEHLFPLFLYNFSSILTHYFWCEISWNFIPTSIFYELHTHNVYTWKCFKETSNLLKKVTT